MWPLQSFLFSPFLLLFDLAPEDHRDPNAAKCYRARLRNWLFRNFGFVRLLRPNWRWGWRRRWRNVRNNPYVILTLRSSHQKMTCRLGRAGPQVRGDGQNGTVAWVIGAVKHPPCPILKADRPKRRKVAGDAEFWVLVSLLIPEIPGISCPESWLPTEAVARKHERNREEGVARNHPTQSLWNKTQRNWKCRNRNNTCSQKSSA